MRARAIGLFLATLLAATPSARADDATQGKALLAGGIISDAGSLASAIACGVLFTSDIGRSIDNPVPGGGNSSSAVIASCALNVGLGIAGIALTVAGTKKLQRGRALHYTLNGVAVRF